MHKNPRNEQWLDDARGRQRNLVFPDTVRNEGLFWRNLSNRPWKRSTKAGMGILGISFYAFLTVILVSAFKEGVGWRLLLGIILFCGPIFAVIASATRRSLREFEQARGKHKRTDS